MMDLLHSHVKMKITFLILEFKIILQYKLIMITDVLLQQSKIIEDKFTQTGEQK